MTNNNSHAQGQFHDHMTHSNRSLSLSLSLSISLSLSLLLLLLLLLLLSLSLSLSSIHYILFWMSSWFEWWYILQRTTARVSFWCASGQLPCKSLSSQRVQCGECDVQVCQYYSSCVTTTTAVVWQLLQQLCDNYYSSCVTTARAVVWQLLQQLCNNCFKSKTWWTMSLFGSVLFYSKQTVISTAPMCNHTCLNIYADVASTAPPSSPPSPPSHTHIHPYTLIQTNTHIHSYASTNINAFDIDFARI